MAVLTAAKKALLNKMNSRAAKAGLGDLESPCIVYSGLKTTAGGAAAEAITISGAAVGDTVHADVNTNGATPRTIVTGKVTATDTVTVTFSGDPSTDHVINLSVIRTV